MSGGRAGLAFLSVTLVLVVVLLVARVPQRDAGAASAPPPDAVTADLSTAAPLEAASPLLDSAEIEREPSTPLPASSPCDTASAGHGSRARDAVLLVRTIRADDGAALADIGVWAQEQDLADHALESFLSDLRSPSMVLGETLFSGSDGAVEYHVPSNVALAVEAGGSGAEFGFPVHVEVEPLAPAERRALDVRLPVGGQHFFGRVIDRASGEPIADARVGVREGDAYSDVALVTSVADGGFELAVSDQRTFRLRIEADGYAPAWGAVTADHDTPARALVLALCRPATIVGRVVWTSGMPEQEVAIWAGCRAEQLFPTPTGKELAPSADRDPGVSSWLEADGSFRLEGLPPRAPLTLYAIAGPRWQRHQVGSAKVTLDPGEQRVLELALPGP